MRESSVDGPTPRRPRGRRDARCPEWWVVSGTSMSPEERGHLDRATDADRLHESRATAIVRSARLMQSDVVELARALAAASAIPPRLAFSPDECARALGVSRDFLDEHVMPELRIVRRGRRRLVPVRELERWLDREAALVLDRERARR
jgi:hypothetical protein